MQVMAAQFGKDAMKRLKEFEFSSENQHPEGNADDAFGNELVGRRSRDHGWLIVTAASTAIPLAMIPAPMSADFDFEDVAIGRAGDFLKWFAATRTTFLVIGQGAVFIRDRQMFVVASTMALAAALLSA
jgi:hypothetical protein